MSSLPTIGSRRWMWILAAPQLAVIATFVLWPAVVALRWSFYLEQPFGLANLYVGFDNYVRLLYDSSVYLALFRSLIFMIVASTMCITFSLALALAADRRIRLAQTSRRLLVWPKAVAGAVVGIVLQFLLNPYTGFPAPLVAQWPDVWQPSINGLHGNIMILIGYIWAKFPFAFLVFLAGLQAVPDTYHQAAAMDGASPLRRVFDIQLPLLTPQIFLALVLECSESLRGTFSLIDTMTQGGPGGATTQLVYKIYMDGFKGLDFSGSSALSVLLILVIATITWIQFAVLEKRVKYER
jgi:sn-glycerol 3-phosphate transport system permease protein